MKISNTEELKRFLIKHFEELSEDEYINIMANTLQVYEHGKPLDLEALLNKIDVHGAYINQLPADNEAPLFLIADYEKNVQTRNKESRDTRI